MVVVVSRAELSPCREWPLVVVQVVWQYGKERSGD
jgi:hypothetical protein